MDDHQRSVIEGRVGPGSRIPAVTDSAGEQMRAIAVGTATDTTGWPMDLGKCGCHSKQVPGGDR